MTILRKKTMKINTLLADKAAALIKTYLTQDAGVEYVESDISEIQNEIIDSLSSRETRVDAYSLLNAHSSYNYSFFTGVYDYSLNRITLFSGDKLTADRIKDLSEVTASGETALTHVKGIKNGIRQSKSFNNMSICTISASPYFSENLFNNFCGLFFKYYERSRQQIRDISSVYGSLMKTLSMFNEKSPGYCEIFHLRNFEKIFGHTGFHNIMSITSEIRKYLLNGSDDKFLFQISPCVYAVIRTENSGMIENPVFEHSGIPVKIDRRLSVCSGTMQYQDILNHIRSMK